MKKFIRTEDGIYEVVGFDDECIIPSPIIKMNGKLTHCSDYKNCKQADTIEELCDEYVLPKFRDVFAIDTFSKQICINHIKCGNGDAYGAIWTSKGLIYVAKMNEKGELELI